MSTFGPPPRSKNRSPPPPSPQAFAVLRPGGGGKQVNISGAHGGGRQGKMDTVNLGGHIQISVQFHAADSLQGVEVGTLQGGWEGSLPSIIVLLLTWTKTSVEQAKKLSSSIQDGNGNFARTSTPPPQAKPLSKAFVSEPKLLPRAMTARLNTTVMVLGWTFSQFQPYLSPDDPEGRGLAEPKNGHFAFQKNQNFFFLGTPQT